MASRGAHVCTYVRYVQKSQMCTLVSVSTAAGLLPVNGMSAALAGIVALSFLLNLVRQKKIGWKEQLIMVSAFL